MISKKWSICTSMQCYDFWSFLIFSNHTIAVHTDYFFLIIFCSFYFTPYTILFFCLSPAALEFWKQINFETMNSLGSLWGCNMSQVWVLSWGVWQRTWRGKKYNFIKNYKVYDEKNEKNPKKNQKSPIKPNKTQ